MRQWVVVVRIDRRLSFWTMVGDCVRRRIPVAESPSPGESPEMSHGGNIGREVGYRVECEVARLVEVDALHMYQVDVVDVKEGRRRFRMAMDTVHEYATET